jgi:hypothetical protein
MASDIRSGAKLPSTRGEADSKTTLAQYPRFLDPDVGTRREAKPIGALGGKGYFALKAGMPGSGRILSLSLFARRLDLLDPRKRTILHRLEWLGLP